MALSVAYVRRLILQPLRAAAETMRKQMRH